MINAHEAVRPTGICSIQIWLVTNQQEEPNFKHLVDQIQTMLPSYHLLINRRANGLYPGFFEMDIKFSPNNNSHVNTLLATN
jgi:hypothetical protein